MSPLKTLYSLGKSFYQGGAALFYEGFGALEYAARSRKGLHGLSKTINKGTEFISIFYKCVPLINFTTYTKAFSQFAGSLSVIKQIQKFPPSFSRGKELKGVSQLLRTVTKVCTTLKYLNTYNFISLLIPGWARDSLKIGDSFFALAGFASQFRYEKEFEKYCLDHYNKYQRRFAEFKAFADYNKPPKPKGASLLPSAAATPLKTSSDEVETKNKDNPPDDDPDGSRKLTTIYFRKVMLKEVEFLKLLLGLKNPKKTNKTDGSPKQIEDIVKSLSKLCKDIIGEGPTVANLEENDKQKLWEELLDLEQAIRDFFADPRASEIILESNIKTREILKLPTGFQLVSDVEGNYRQELEELAPLCFQGSSQQVLEAQKGPIKLKDHKIVRKLKELLICQQALALKHSDILEFIQKLMQYRMKKWDVCLKNHRTTEKVRLIGVAFHAGTLFCGAVGLGCFIFGFTTPAGLLIIGQFLVNGIGFIKCYIKAKTTYDKPPEPPIFMLKKTEDKGSC